MAAGYWNKAKLFFKDLLSGLGTGLQWVNDNIVKPVIQPIAQTVAPFFGAPGIGVSKLIDSGSNLIDTIQPVGTGHISRGQQSLDGILASLRQRR